ncbi:MAG: hypothetical protein ABIH34_00915 [Nanoarchaeota archaeon]
MRIALIIACVVILLVACQPTDTQHPSPVDPPPGNLAGEISNIDSTFDDSVEVTPPEIPS